MSEMPTRFCGQCGEPSTAPDKFCTACGNRLVQSSESASSAGLPPPRTVVDQQPKTERSSVGLLLVDSKGSFVVPDELSPKPMRFAESVKHCFHNYVNFRGRASRSEYWYFMLLYPVLLIPVALAAEVVGPSGSGQTSDGAFALSLFFSLATLGLILPAMAVGVRRLHDTGRSAKWVLLGLVPFGGLVILFFLCEAGDETPNRFGPSWG